MRKLTALATLALLSLGACSDDDPVAPTPKGRVRVVHAITGVATTDILFGTDIKKADLAFKGVHENAATPVGNATIKVRKADATADLVSVAQAIENGKAYTIIAFGTEATPQSLALAEDLAAPAAGKAKVRVAHAAAAQGAVDMYVLEDAEELEDADPTKANLAMKAASDYVVVDGGDYDVILTAPGTKDVLLTIANVQLAAGKVVTLVATEKAAGGAPLESVTLIDR